MCRHCPHKFLLLGVHVFLLAQPRVDSVRGASATADVTNRPAQLPQAVAAAAEHAAWRGLGADLALS